ncbi:ubiquinone/menaquinone biosynthesis C-methylase UbiE [Pullulanibacillus pueri]|uniref:Methyltransferase n=1 Tax=Pullulanibacillus pueri TaxID=1437324 RepID=A0A8J3ENH2_9BACL|nr:class I SAM-dependent methyltransferase [Pullulanibacillus pueri]MBM7683390.1 ubiquinone/menaquinone biosynthesis C-methylase UbiE [Pullulanibacillus pueri]GGH86509.1 methyltransferase [Pullulanibacillus pueri]
MKAFDYENFYERVGKTNGWDFSHLKSFSEGVRWDFYDEVVKRCEKTDILLDIGTGGGEKLLSIASSLFLLVGIDLSHSMINTALSHLKKLKVPNVKFFQMSSDELQFPMRFFDVVSSCHAPFSSLEVAKVLKSGGWFLTQQVSEADKWNIKEAFGRGQAYDKTDGSLKKRYIRELNEAGFSEIQSFEYDAIEYYERPEDLIFLLKHTPIIPYFGQDKMDFEILKDFIENNKSEKGIQTNSKRFLIIARR